MTKEQIIALINDMEVGAKEIIAIADIMFAKQEQHQKRLKLLYDIFTCVDMDDKTKLLYEKTIKPLKLL